MPSHPPPPAKQAIAPHQVWRHLNSKQQKQAHQTLITLLHQALMSPPPSSSLENSSNEPLN